MSRLRTLHEEHFLAPNQTTALELMVMIVFPVYNCRLLLRTRTGARLSGHHMAWQ